MNVSTFQRFQHRCFPVKFAKFLRTSPVADSVSKAFDMRNHSLLQAKLEAPGFSTNSLKSMQTYL